MLLRCDRQQWPQWIYAEARHIAKLFLCGFVGHSFIPAPLMLADCHYHLFDCQGPSCVQGSNTPQPLSQPTPPPSPLYPSLPHSASQHSLKVQLKNTHRRERWGGREIERREGALIPNLRWPNQTKVYQKLAQQTQPPYWWGWSRAGRGRRTEA